MQPSLFIKTMKRLLIFIFALAFLITSEYYLLNEIFSQKRFPVIAVTLAIAAICIFVFIRFFKRNIISPKL